MKKCLVIALIWAIGVCVRAEPLAPANAGYEVIVDVTVGPDGKIEQVQVVHADIPLLGRVGVAMARRLKLTPRMENGEAVRSVQRAPIFFPVEGDLGPEAMKRPLPTPRLQPAPNYPFELRRAGKPGGAIVSMLVDKKGDVREAKLVRASEPDFGRASLQAANTWRFKPATENGAPVESRVNVAFVFEADGKGPDWKWYLAPRPALDAYIVTATFIPVRN